MGASAFLTKGRVLGDVVRHIFHPGFNYESGSFENHLGTAIDLADVCGMPVKKVTGKWRSVQAGDEANATGLLLLQGPLALANGATYGEKVTVLVRGPALVDKDKIRTTDSSGAAINVTTVMTALNALNIREQTEPTQTTTQTT